MTEQEPDQRLTPAERARLVERHIEVCLMRRYMDEHNLHAVLGVAKRLSDRLKALGG